MTNDNNYIKIEIINSVPKITIKYEDLESFQNLIFCVLSNAGSNLILRTIESELTIQNKLKELEALKVFIEIFSADKTNENMFSSKFPILKPSSFK